MDNATMLYSGKAKSVYKTDREDQYIVEFRDDTTAFDGAKKAALTAKGRINHAISNHLMQLLAQEGIPTHWVKAISPTCSVVKALKMMPVECVVRNVAMGSLCRRLGVQSGLSLTPPLYELFLKNDELHDPMINEDHAVSFGWAESAHLAVMREYSLQINTALRRILSDAGLLLIDAKYEFGIADGEVVLGDEISPDSCRIWDALTHEPLDKDRFRQDMGGVVDSYAEIASRLGLVLDKVKVE